MASFSVNPSMSMNEIVGAINYLLANINPGLSVNAKTGQIIYATDTTLTPGTQYIYQYCYFAFASSPDGVVNFTQDPSLGYTYYGIWNTPNLTPGGSANPANYVWYPVPATLMPPINQFYYAVLSPYNIEIFSENIASRVYLVYPAVGQDITVVTNNIISGQWVLGDLPYWDSYNQTWSSIAPGAADTILVSNGSTATYITVGQLTSITGANADNILVNNTTLDVYYYPAMVDTFGTYTTINADNDFAFYNTSTGNILYTPNIENSGTITLLPLAAAPTTFTTGTVAMANAVNWDPAAYSATTPYLTVYNGTNWIALG